MIEKVLPVKTRLYISPCSKHRCTGTPRPVAEQYELKGAEKIYTLTRCTTCGKVFVCGGDIQEIIGLGQIKSFPYTVCDDASPVLREGKTLIVRLDDPDDIDSIVLADMNETQKLSFRKDSGEMEKRDR